MRLFTILVRVLVANYVGACGFHRILYRTVDLSTFGCELLAVVFILVERSAEAGVAVVRDVHIVGQYVRVESLNRSAVNGQRCEARRALHFGSFVEMQDVFVALLAVVIHAVASDGDAGGRVFAFGIFKLDCHV